MVGTALAFVKRDFLQDISYKGPFAFRLAAILFWVPVMYFVSGVFEGTASAFLKPYGGGYFPFLLIGVALLDYHALSLQIFSNSIRESQMMGTLEIMLLSPTRLPAMIIYSSLWGYIFTSFRFILYLLAGSFLFNLNLGNANLPAASVVLLLSIVCFAGLGITLASFIVLLKQAGSLDLFLRSASLLLGGVVYPIEVLPEWLRQASFVIPITYSLSAMRLTLLQGYSLGQVRLDVLALVTFSVVFLPVGLLAFHFAVQRVKHTGTLGHY